MIPADDPIHPVRLFVKFPLDNILELVQGGRFTVTLVGHVMTGFCVSFTVTVNEQFAVPWLLVAVTVTVVVPTLNKEPEAFEYVMVGVGLPVAVAFAYVTFLPHIPVVAVVVIFAGQVTVSPVPNAVATENNITRSEKKCLKPKCVEMFFIINSIILEYLGCTKTKKNLYSATIVIFNNTSFLS